MGVYDVKYRDKDGSVKSAKFHDVSDTGDGYVKAERHATAIFDDAGTRTSYIKKEDIVSVNGPRDTKIAESDMRDGRIDLGGILGGLFGNKK